MKKNKGFTLVELLGVLTLLAILMLLAFPNFTNLTSNAKSNYDRTSKVLIRGAARMYVDNNSEEIFQVLQTRDYYCLPVGKLIAYEYLDSEIYSQKNTINKDSIVIVTHQNNEFVYDVENKRNATLSSCGITDYLPPVITIKKQGDTQCGSVTKITANSLDEAISKYDTDCKIQVTDNESPNTTYTFEGIKVTETNNNLNRNIKLDKIVYIDDKNNDKIYITYNASDSSGNKAIPLKIQLIKE